MQFTPEVAGALNDFTDIPDVYVACRLDADSEGCCYSPVIAPLFMAAR